MDEPGYMNLLSNVYFMKSKYRSSIPDENLASELRWAVSGYTVDFEDLVWKEMQNIPLNVLYID